MLTSRVALNIGLWGTNLATAVLVMPRHRELFGPLLDATGGFLILDLLSYGIHRAQHAIPLLWSFHRVHHSDTAVGLTTAVRHHPAEFMSSGLAFWAAIAVLGVPVGVAATHSLATFALAVATHMRRAWPGWIERYLRPVLVTLDLHLTHHSADRQEANSNFGAVLSVWDRLFGTYREGPRPSTFGVPPMYVEMAASQWPNSKRRLHIRLIGDDGTIIEARRRDYTWPSGHQAAVTDLIKDFRRSTNGQLPAEFYRDPRIRAAFDHPRAVIDPFV